MLFVGDDCAEDHHDIEVVDEQGRRLARRRLPEGLEGVTRLHALIAGVMPSEWAFGELLRHLAEHNIVELIEGPAKGDPEVTLPEHGDREAAFSLLRSVVVDLAGSDGSVALSGLKNQLRKVRPDFSEKKLGYRSFLQFCKAAATAGAVDLQWSSDADDYLLTANKQT